LKGYSTLERQSEYSEVKQRWVLVESAERRRSDIKKIAIIIEKT